MNHRVCFNGSPLDDSLDNVARLGRRLGYAPALFGYTDQGVDPRTTQSADDPRLSTYQGVLPGFDWVLDLSEPFHPWLDLLREHGHHYDDWEPALVSEPERDESLSITHFLTDKFLTWHAEHAPPSNDSRRRPWFAHLSYLRPHPPYGAAGRWSHEYDPASVDMPIAPSDDRHGFHDAVIQHPLTSAPSTEAGMRKMRAQYYGMIGEVDAELGRVFAALRERGEWHDTVIVITADHGEQLGDHGLREKVGFFEQSYHIVGIMRAPQSPSGHGRVVDAFTENVDVFPTLCELLDAPVPPQCDGRSLVPCSSARRQATGARWRRGNTTGGSSTSPMMPTVRHSTGRATDDSNDKISACSATPMRRTYSSATATGSPSTSQPTPRGARQFGMPRECCHSRNACSRGARSTPTAD